MYIVYVCNDVCDLYGSEDIIQISGFGDLPGGYQTMRICEDRKNKSVIIELGNSRLSSCGLGTLHLAFSKDGLEITKVTGTNKIIKMMKISAEEIYPRSKTELVG